MGSKNPNKKINNSLNNKNEIIHLFEKIKSNIIFNIFSYIKDENYLLKLIYFQKV